MSETAISLILILLFINLVCNLIFFGKGIFSINIPYRSPNKTPLYDIYKHSITETYYISKWDYKKGTYGDHIKDNFPQSILAFFVYIIVPFFINLTIKSYFTNGLFIDTEKLEIDEVKTYMLKNKFKNIGEYYEREASIINEARKEKNKIKNYTETELSKLNSEFDNNIF